MRIDDFFEWYETIFKTRWTLFLSCVIFFPKFHEHILGALLLNDTNSFFWMVWNIFKAMWTFFLHCIIIFHKCDDEMRWRFIEWHESFFLKSCKHFLTLCKHFFMKLLRIFFRMLLNSTNHIFNAINSFWKLYELFLLQFFTCFYSS